MKNEWVIIFTSIIDVCFRRYFLICHYLLPSKDKYQLLTEMKKTSFLLSNKTCKPEKQYQARTPIRIEQGDLL